MGKNNFFILYFWIISDKNIYSAVAVLHSLPVLSTLWRVPDAVAELLSNFLSGQHTRLRSAGLNTKQHSWKEKASAPKRLQSTNMAFEKDISAIFFLTGLHFSIPEAVLRIYNWPPRVIEVRPHESKMFKVYMSFFWKSFILLNILTNKF